MRYRKFNVDKELKKIKFKRNREKYFKLGIFVTCIIGVVIGSIYFTKSTYNSNTTYLPVNNKVEEFKAYDYLIAAYINNEETFNYPLKNTGYELDNFTCDNAVGSWNRDSWSLNLTNISARTKCYLYFRNATYSLKYYVGDTEVSTIPSSSDYNFTSASCDNGASISFNTDTWSPTVSNVLGDNVCSLYFEDKITIINFSINGTAYQAEEGMSWNNWLNSGYSNGFKLKYNTYTYSEIVNLGYTHAYYPFIEYQLNYNGLYNGLFSYTTDTSKPMGCILSLYSSSVYKTDNWKDSATQYANPIIFNEKIVDTIANADLQIFNIAYNESTDNLYYIECVYELCLSPDTIIEVYDEEEKKKKKKKLKYLKVGDKVICVNPITGEEEIDEVTYTDYLENKHMNQYDKWYFEDGTIIETINKHRFFNIERNDFTYMNEWKIGDHGYNIKGQKIKLIKHELIKEDIRHCTLFTKKYNNYFANGMLSGNRHSDKIKIHA